MLLAACGGGGAFVASVNDFDITLADVEALSPEGEDGSIAQTTFTQLLQNLIFHRAVVDYADTEFSVMASDEEIQGRIDELLEQFAADDTLPIEDQLAEQNATLALVEVVAWQQVIQQLLLDRFEADAQPSQEEIDVLYEQNLQALSNVCARHILFLTELTPETTEEQQAEILETAEANAEAALARAEDGEDFAELAVELSEGPSGPDGGDLGCNAPSAYVPEFANATLEAALNTPFGPVRTQFGYHLILVTERTVPELAEVQDQLVSQLAATSSQEQFQSFVVDALIQAEVMVDETYGVWVEGSGGQPPQLLPPPS